MSQEIRYIFVVRNAMHYLNALELQYVRKLPKKECALFFIHANILDKDFSALVDEADWGHLDYIQYPIKPKDHPQWYFKPLKPFIKLYTKWASTRAFVKNFQTFIDTHTTQPLEFISVGNYFTRESRHMVGTLQQQNWVKEVIVGDEGTSTIPVLVPIRHDPESVIIENLKGRFTKKDKTKDFLRLTTGMVYNHPESVTLFTMYNVEDVPPHDRIEKNTFARVKEMAANYRRLDEVWFAGSGLVPHNLADPEKYLAILREVKNTFKGEKLIYLPHPVTKKHTLDAIEAIGFKVFKPDTALEPWMIQERIMPKAWTAISSTSTDVILRVFGDKIPVHLYEPTPDFFTVDQTRKFHLDIIKAQATEHAEAVQLHKVSFDTK